METNFDIESLVAISHVSFNTFQLLFRNKTVITSEVTYVYNKTLPALTDPICFGNRHHEFELVAD